MKKLGAVLLFALTGTVNAADRLQTVLVSGLSVPGTPTIAKELGFTECADKYRYYECKRIKPVAVYGATADTASVFFNGKDNFSTKPDSSDGPKVSEVPPEKLSYSSIRLDFHLTEREKLEKALIADGWLRTGTGNSREYFKQGVAATFSIHRSLTMLSPVDLGEVEKQISVLKKKAAETEKTDASTGSFIEAMKK
jgi:hypothetical protein